MKALVPVSALLLSVGFLLTGHGLLTTLLPLRALSEGYSSFQVGILGAAYFLGFGTGALLGPYAIRRVGHIRTFAAMVAVICIAVLFQAMLTTPVFWWVMRAATGFCLSTLYIVIESWVNEKSTNEDRGLVFSIYTMINLSVITAGQLLTTLADPMEFALFAVAVMLFSASIFPVSMTRNAAPVATQHVRIRARYLIGLSPVAMVGALAIGLTNGAFWSLGPVFAQRDPSDTGMVAAFMSTTVIAGALGQWPLGRMSDRIDRRIVIIVAAMGAALAAGGHVAAVYYWRVGILPCAAIFGFFAFPLYGICAAHLNDFVEADGYVEAASGLLLVYAVGAVVGPMLAAASMGQIGNEALFLFTASVHGSLVLFAAFRMCWRRAPARHEKLAFSDSLITAGTVANLDLRSDAELKDEALDIGGPANYRHSSPE